MKKQTKQNLKILISFLLLISVLTFLILDIILFYESKFSYEFSYGDNLTINYQNLTQEEIIYFEDIFSQINPLYLYNQQEIIITKNMSEYSQNYSGYNFNKGEKIIIKFHKNEEILKRTISHELMHTYIKREKGDSDKNHPIHQIVYDLARKKVAFDE